MSQLFISHATADDAFVRDLRWTLADLKQDAWIDSRELRGGDPLWPDIQKAIERASGFAVVVSPDALQSAWVGRELTHALEVQKQRGKDNYPVIPLSLNGARLGVMEVIFGEPPVYLPVSSAPGGVEAAMNPLLVALRRRLPADVPPTPQPEPEPLEELVLELTDLKFHEQDGVRRPSARARLIYEPATPGRREVVSDQPWRFIAPLGPIEAQELRWYLEKYAVWPSHYFRARARQVEDNLARWGQDLYRAALPLARTAEVLQAWATVDGQAGRRFSVHVNAALEAGAPPTDVAAAKEAATLILGLPWELLHAGDAYLFQGARPTRVRRRLPNTKLLDVTAVAAPIRILLVTARPEDSACGYIDHRASALPLVDAMEALGGLVRLRLLVPPTLPALDAELRRALQAGEPYHVVHFDGHGVYDRRVGLGGLCFEDPNDVAELEQRRHRTVFTSELGPLLTEHRIPLVFLESCQTAQAEDASESVASDLLQRGVASVVAMSHSVLVETSRRFVQPFYAALAWGVRVGDAMLEGQRALSTYKSRGRVFGAGDLELHDWFVPVLFQERDDPQLFRNTPAPQTQQDLRTILTSRLGELPGKPDTGFIGRSRELLALERLLFASPKEGEGPAPRYAVVRGQGGEGKTALAAELARWLVRSQQVRRAAFVSVETHGNRRAVVDGLGRQLIGKDFSAAGDLEAAIQQVERALVEQPTLLVVDNMESVLLPPYLAAETPEALSEDAARELAAILDLCARLGGQGDTRLVITSREPLPAPFDAERHRRDLRHLAREDAVKLVERVLNVRDGEAGPGKQVSTGGAVSRPPEESAREEIEQLVDAVNCHARTLALLAPALRANGVKATRESLTDLMAKMEAEFPGSREQSVFASVELSLRRMTPANRDRARVLGVFHGGVGLDTLRAMMRWEEGDVASLATELVQTGLATPDPYNHLTLNPALCPYLRGRLDAAEREALTARWVEAMSEHVEILRKQRHQNTQMAATLTGLELPNLFALLDRVQRAGDAEATIDLVTSLYTLLQGFGKLRLLERVGQVRDAAARALGNAWTHARFDEQLNRNQQLLDKGHLCEALESAQQLLQTVRAVGELAYPSADYDLARACFRVARVLKTAGSVEQALPLLDEARRRFEAIVKARPDKSAAGMASACLMEQGDCLLGLGRLDEAAAAYEEAIRRAEQRGAKRDVAVGKGNRGTVRLQQRRYKEALAAHAEARARFTRLDESASVAVFWHRTGMTYQEAGQPEAAEDAYRQALAISVRLGDAAGQARTLTQLGLLYDEVLGRPQDAALLHRQAVDKYVENGDAAGEGRARNNLAMTLRRLRRLEEARQEIRRAMVCGAPFGLAFEMWKAWHILAAIETDAGASAAAAEAKRQARDCYCAYRRAGGENHDTAGDITHAVTQSLSAGDPAAAAALLQQWAPRFEAAGYGGFIRALQAIVAGSRDRTLADAPDLHPTMAAEILLLLDALEKP